MKAYAVLTLVVLSLFLSPAAVSQTCYTPVTSWQGTYSLSGNGSGSDAFGLYSWTVSHQVTGVPNLALLGASCTTLAWTGPDASATGTANDFGTNKCGDGSPDTEAFAGGPTFLTAGNLLISPGAGTFQYIEDPIVTVTETSNSCGTINTSSIPLQLFPYDAACTGTPLIPTIPLPPNAQELSGEAPLSGVAICPYAVPASWTFTYDLVPVIKVDDDCKKKGGSSVGCRNQSLGEDVDIVGTGLSLHYEGSRSAASGADSVANTDAMMIGGWTLSVHHAYNAANNTLYLGNGSQRNGYQLGAPVLFMGNTLITSAEGDEIYVFNPSGQHLQTLRPLTGALLYQFGYDASGRLITVTDANNNVTTIKRTAAGKPTAIVSPFAQTTALTLDANGFLTQVKDPLGKTSLFVNTAAGSLISRTDANGNVYNYTYDNAGKLIKDADPVGGFHALTRTNATTGIGWTVAHQTALGVPSSYQDTQTFTWIEDPNNPTFSEQQTNVWPNGLQATTSKTLQSGKLVEALALPDGTSLSQTSSPDPVWGLQMPFVSSETLTQGNLTMQRTATRSITLGTTGNPFSVATETDTETVNGRVYTSTFTGSNLTYVHTSPVKRTLTVTMDSQERPARVQPGGLAAVSLVYTPKGQIASISEGTRKSSFTYNAKGFLATETDPLLLKTTRTYDANGNLLTTTLPDARVVSKTYDGNGNLLTVTPPGKSAHTFTYTPVDLPASYTPPGGAPATTFTYDLDRNLTSVVRPGNQIIAYSYDTAGRLTKVTIPTATETLTYNATTGNVASAARGTERVAYTYNGPLPTKSTWTGPMAGNVGLVYNNNFWVTSQTVNGGTPVAFKYDNDGLITSAGAMTVRRNATNGAITGTTLGVVADARTYNTLGELTGYTATVNGTPVYSYQLTINADGKITATSETIGGVSNSYAYSYDLANRLTGVTKNGVANSYSYDTNSNRLSATTSSGTVSAGYDAQDRLTTYGSTAFTYTLAGDLLTQKTGTQQSTYTYDALGNLTAVTLPNGTKITYVIDGKNNRVGKSINGVYSTGFLYDDGRVVAQLNGSNQLISQFIYVGELGSPDFMISGASTYRILRDPVGSPVLVIDIATGTIIEQVAYDEFGNVLADTNPGFQPFGFAGGLYDQDTKLVRFGARDYNPLYGRWTTKDPALFAGRDTNLYGYVGEDPVNSVDPSGLWPKPGSIIKTEYGRCKCDGPKEVGYREFIVETHAGSKPGSPGRYNHEELATGWVVWKEIPSRSPCREPSWQESDRHFWEEVHANEKQLAEDHPILKFLQDIGFLK